MSKFPILLRQLLAEVEKEINPSLTRTNFALNLIPEVKDYLSSVRNLPYTVHDWRHSQKVEELCTILFPIPFLKRRILIPKIKSIEER